MNQLFPRHMKMQLRRFDIKVTQQLLDVFDINPYFQQMCGIPVSQRMQHFITRPALPPSPVLLHLMLAH
jgi:hypothetical protein